MIRNLKYFLLALLASVLFNSCFVVEKQNVETSAKESYSSTQPSVSEVRSTSASTETDLTDYSYLDGSWYEDTLHEKSNLRDYFYRIKGNQISVVDKKHNKKETFFGFKISNGKVTISSKGEDSKKIAPGTYPISIKSENQFTISFAKPMSFIRNTYAHNQAEAFVEKATDISLGAGAISGLSGALDMGVQIGIDAKNAEYAKAIAEAEAALLALPIAPIPHLINQHMAGKTNDVGVHYNWKKIEYQGKDYRAVFPEFDPAYATNLPNDLLLSTDKDQFAYCSNQLYNAIQNDKKLRTKFSTEQIEQLSYGWTPDGYTWHHNEQKGVMQLVDSYLHENSRHTGGRAIWGGGGENRK